MKNILLIFLILASWMLLNKYAASNFILLKLSRIIINFASFLRTILKYFIYKLLLLTKFFSFAFMEINKLWFSLFDSYSKEVIAKCKINEISLYYAKGVQLDIINFLRLLFLTIYIYNFIFPHYLICNFDNLTTLILITNPFINTANINFVKLNPWYITGFSCGEGSFTFSISPGRINKEGEQKWIVTSTFALVAVFNAANMLQFEHIKEFFGVGRIKIQKARGNRKASIYFIVDSFNDCLIIRDHFNKYPLLGTNLVHFNIWSQVLELKTNNAHLNEEGLHKIVALKTYSPKGISDKLKLAFPNYVNYIISEPSYKPNFANLNMYWLCGFMQADSMFKVNISNSASSKLGVQCNIIIQITQHSKNLLLLEKIQTFLNMGKIYFRKDRDAVDLKITNLKDANDFISKFDSVGHNLLGAKALDYLYIFVQ